MAPTTSVAAAKMRAWSSMRRGLAEGAAENVTPHCWPRARCFPLTTPRSSRRGKRQSSSVAKAITTSFRPPDAHSTIAVLAERARGLAMENDPDAVRAGLAALAAALDALGPDRAGDGHGSKA
jgi:hypothetical protein